LVSTIQWNEVKAEFL